MDTPTKVIVNCETGTQEVVPLTEAEIAELETARINAEVEAAAREAEALEKAAARQALLARLGITEDEARLLLS